MRRKSKLGTIQKEWVIVEGFASTDTSAIDRMMEKCPLILKAPQALLYPSWFSNAGVQYVFVWDGSKEGWDVSDKGDRARVKFIKLALDLGLNVFRVVHGEIDGLLVEKLQEW